VSQATSLYVPSDGSVNNRLFCCLVISPAGRAISEFKSRVELLEALRDAIKAHRSLYLTGKILHRDISENNIIITDPKKADGFSGMLIDLDLAKEVGAGRSGARHQTGTMEFMAIEVLRNVAHTYRHDLESFFYVLLWMCARRAWEREFQCRLKDQPKKSRLTKWYTGNYNDIAEAKRGYMHADGLEDILDEFPQAFDCVKPLCREIRGILFPYKDGLFIGTPLEPEKLYGPILKVFNEAIPEITRIEQSGG
jgi:serine/threonine protein kinase